MRYFVHFSQGPITRFQFYHKHTLTLFLRMDSDKVLALIQRYSEHIFIRWNNIILDIEQVVIKQSSVHVLNIESYISDFSDISFYYVVRILYKQCLNWCDNDIQIIVVGLVCSFMKLDTCQTFIFSWNEFISLTNSKNVLIWLWNFGNRDSLILKLIAWVWWDK